MMSSDSTELHADVSSFDDGETEEFNYSNVSGEPGTDAAINQLSDSMENSTSEFEELDAIRARVKEMEEEAEKIKELQSEVEKQMSTSSTGSASALREDKSEIDARSVYVGNVDYSATAEELEQHFHGCGAVNRVTIMCDKFKGTPKGFAYIEFTDKDSVMASLALDDSLFKGRQIKVVQKRTNVPGISSTDRPAFGGRGGYRGSRRGSRASFYNPYSLSRGGIAGGRRPRRRPSYSYYGFSPY